MPRFALIDLFWCVTLIAAGIGGYRLWTWSIASEVINANLPELAWIPIILLVFGTCGACIGAGLGALFKHKRRGAMLGFFLAAGIPISIMLLFGALALTAP